MSDVSKTNAELITEARTAAPGDDPTQLAVTVHRLAAALESATRVPVQGEASAAIERVRAIHEPTEGIKIPRTFAGEPEHACRACLRAWPCSTIAALDGAPEPEWEMGAALASDLTEATAHPDKETALKNIQGWNESVEKMTRQGRKNSGPSVPVRRRKAGPWLPVEGESNA